jgi:predicted  nucleic acid-binding Zn-ribbon protein
LKRLLELQELDLKIEEYLRRELEIPKQKEKFDICRKRLEEELQASEERHKSLILEQRSCEKEIEEKQEEIRKKDGQLLAVKKNEEYQALLHEMDMCKKQIAQKEERIITIMVEMDDSKAHFEEDKKRIAEEQGKIDAECRQIDDELAEAVKYRESLEGQRGPLEAGMEKKLISQYTRIRRAKKTGAVVVPLHGEACSGCHMMVRAQAYNEILAGGKFHACTQCGRLLYHEGNFENETVDVTEGSH